MVEEALRGNANTKGTLIYTRPDWVDRYVAQGIRTVPTLPYKGEKRWDEPFQWGSGPYAVLIAALFARERYVNLIGFDLWSQTKKINNIYKDTPNYENSDYRSVDPRYWIHQRGKLFELYPNKTFKIYQNSNWVLPKAWIHPNVMVDKISIIV